MKKLKRTTTIILSLIFALTFSISTFATTTPYEVEDLDIVLNLPENVYAFLATASPSDPMWETANVEDPAEVLQLCKDLGTTVLLTANNGATSIFLSKTMTDTTQKYYNFNHLSDEEFDKFIADSNYGDASSLLAVATPFVGATGQKFVLSQFSGIDQYEEPIYEVALYTIVNGNTVSFTHHSTTEIPQSTIELLESLASGVEFNNVIAADEKPQMSFSQALLALFFITAIILGIIIFFIVMLVKSKKAKKNDLALAERISTYRTVRLDPDHQSGEVVFANTTEITDSAISTYSKFQCFKNKLLGPLLTIITSILVVIALIITKSDWWMILIMLVAVGFSAYKLVTSGASLEKTLKRMYQKGHSRKARYTFYENEFSIAGIESNEFHPYFQITSIREHKNYYYFYFGEDNSYFVDKNGFIKGEQKEFAEFIVRKTGKRF